MIEDIQNDGCTDAQIEALLDAYIYTLKKAAAILARKTWFELKDYATSKQHGIENFNLTLEQKDILGQKQWYGVFEDGSKSLKIIGTLEKV